jgi:hypothetical protein
MLACRGAEHAPARRAASQGVPQARTTPTATADAIAPGAGTDDTRIARQVAASIDAVTAAQGRGGTPCEQAYNGMVAMLSGLQHDGGARPPPDRERFIAACSDMPIAVQRCMVFTYVVAHRQECHDARAAVPAEALARMRAVMLDRDR